VTTVAGATLAGDFFRLATVVGLGLEITEKTGVVRAFTLLMRGAATESAVGRWMLVPCTIIYLELIQALRGPESSTFTPFDASTKM
jgi:hypothetical protein